MSKNIDKTVVMVLKQNVLIHYVKQGFLKPVDMTGHITI
jgi:hypothetical protein